jgi:hypothetical protein
MTACVKVSIALIDIPQTVLFDKECVILIVKGYAWPAVYVAGRPVSVIPPPVILRELPP